MPTTTSTKLHSLGERQDRGIKTAASAFAAERLQRIRKRTELCRRRTNRSRMPDEAALVPIASPCQCPCLGSGLAPVDQALRIKPWG